MGWLLMAVLSFGLLIALDTTMLQAAPFQSPTQELTIHQPLITLNEAEIVSQPAPVETNGIPIAGLIGMLLILLVSAIAYSASRRRT